MEASQSRKNPQEKEKILKEVWSGEKNVSHACQEMGISRVTYYEWEKKALAGMKEGLAEKKKGRRENGGLKTEEELRQKIEQLNEVLKETEKRISKIEREKVKTETDLYIARRVIEWRIEDGTLDIKKNGNLAKIVERLFSVMPKEPPQRDIQRENL